MSQVTPLAESIEMVQYIPQYLIGRLHQTLKRNRQCSLSGKYQSFKDEHDWELLFQISNLIPVMVTIAVYVYTIPLAYSSQVHQ